MSLDPYLQGPGVAEQPIDLCRNFQVLALMASVLRLERPHEHWLTAVLSVYIRES